MFRDKHLVLSSIVKQFKENESCFVSTGLRFIIESGMALLLYSALLLDHPLDPECDKFIGIKPFVTQKNK
jgi:hypothetical protein